MGFFKDLFSEEPTKKRERLHKEKKDDTKSDFNKYKTLKSEINKINSHYPSMISKSMELDFDEFKSKKIIEPSTYTYHPTPEVNIWYIKNINYSSIEFVKKSNGVIRLECDFRFNEGEDIKFEIKSLKISNMGIDLEVTDDLYEIIKKYFFFYKTLKIKKEHEESIKNYQKIVDSIGSDIKRDSIIDRLLSDIEKNN